MMLLFRERKLHFFLLRVLSDQMRTNNSVEGWNRGFEARLQRADGPDEVLKACREDFKDNESKIDR